MANTKSAKKMVRVIARRRAQNRPAISEMRTDFTKTRAAIVEGADNMDDLVRESISTIDRVAKRGIIHPNAAARRKSRLMKLQNAAKAGALSKPAAAKQTSRKRGKKS